MSGSVLGYQRDEWMDRIDEGFIDTLPPPVLSDGSSPILYALYRQRPGVVERLVEMGSVPLPHEPILCRVVESGFSRLLDLFLKKGYPIEQRDERGYTPLYHACRGGQEREIRTLLEWGADPNAETDRCQVAIMVVPVSMIELLIENGASLTHPSVEPDVLLERVIESGFATLELVEALLRAGADPQTGLNGALMWGQADTLDLLYRYGARVPDATPPVGPIVYKVLGPEQQDQLDWYTELEREQSQFFTGMSVMEEYGTRCRSDQRFYLAVYPTESGSEVVAGAGCVLLFERTAHLHLFHTQRLKNPYCRGIGRELMEFLWNDLVERGVESLTVDPVRTSIGFYEKMGFVRTKEATQWIKKV